MLVMMSVLVYIDHAFRGFVAPAVLTGWLAWMWACVAAFSWSVTALLVRRLRAGLPADVFVRARQVVAAAFCLGIVASVWILMPAADLPLRMLMLLLSMWFVAMVVILNPDGFAIYGALAVVASMALFVLVDHMPYAWALAGFLVGEGAALVAIRRFIWRAADRLEGALTITRSERDAKTRFIAAASHDLQQPIQAAWMFAEIAAAAADGDAQAKAVDGMRASFTSVQALLETMLEHLRLEAGAVTVRPAPVGLAQLYDEVAAEHRGAAEAAGVQLSVAATALTVVTDRSLLKRAIGNLVSNAIRHSGGSRVLIGTRHRGSRVAICVIDDGCGVAPVDRAQLFEDYAQGQVRDGAARGGFGIGLASARRIAELLGGSAALDTRWCNGAAFVVTMPTHWSSSR